MANAKKSGGTSDDTGDVQKFMDKLLSESPPGAVFSGMVRAGSEPDYLMFAHIGDCEHWIGLHTSTIKSIKELKRVECRGHSHVVAEIQLNSPTTELEKSFAAVTALHGAKLAGLQLRAGAQTSDQPPSSRCVTGWKRTADGSWYCLD
jgi:hypothetical protein